MLYKIKKSNKIAIKLKVGVIVQYQDRILLIRELNHRTGRFSWNIIKGTFEPERDDDITKTALRESLEEANIKIQLQYLLGIYYLLDERDALTMFTFVADALSPPIEIKNPVEKYTEKENIVEVKLFSRLGLEQLEQKDFVGMRGYLAIQDYLNGKKYPLDCIIPLTPKKKRARNHFMRAVV